MKILLTQCVYNEISLLPWKFQWAQENRIEVFTFDNFSTDGSWEWLNDNGYDCERLDTGGLFSLKLNNRAMLRKFHEVQPDWCVIMGVDMFPVAQGFKLAEFIGLVDSAGYSLIDCSRLFNFYYTGTENNENDPRLEYFYYKVENNWDIALMAKYHDKLYIEGDQFRRTPGKLFKSDLLEIRHYWWRLDARERFREKFQRRNKSWAQEVDSVRHGEHYPDILKRDRWVFDRNELKDIREKD